MIYPFLDPIRPQLISHARLAIDAGTYQREEIMTGALGVVGMTSASPSLWSAACDGFEMLVESVDLWDIETADDEPWVDDPERCVRGVGWSDYRWALCRVLNGFIDTIVFAGLCSHLPLISVRRDGASIVISEVQS